jgi:hypothetical protein
MAATCSAPTTRGQRGRQRAGPAADVEHTLARANAGDVEQAGGQLGSVSTDVAVVGVARVGHDRRALRATSRLLGHPRRSGARSDLPWSS